MIVARISPNSVTQYDRHRKFSRIVPPYAATLMVCYIDANLPLFISDLSAVFDANRISVSVTISSGGSESEGEKRRE